jgi:hypothetical protein
MNNQSETLSGSQIVFYYHFFFSNVEWCCTFFRPPEAGAKSRTKLAQHIRDLLNYYCKIQWMWMEGFHSSTLMQKPRAHSIWGEINKKEVVRMYVSSMSMFILHFCTRHYDYSHVRFWSMPRITSYCYS